MADGHRLSDPLPRRVVILRALQLGDLLCAVPAFRALRRFLPQARITLVGLPWARELVERFPGYLDDLLEFPGYPGLPERPPQVDRVPGFLAAAQNEHFDLALQLQGSGGITNPLTVLLGADRCAGFYRPRQFCPEETRFLPYPDQGHEVRRLLRLLEFLGVPPQGEHLEFPVRDTDYQRLKAIPGADSFRPGGYVCVHPGARAVDRRWPAEHFAAVADALRARGLGIVLTGSREEAHVTRAVAGPSLDLAGRTDLGSLGVLLRGARLLVCNNTGVSHLAAALQVPSVVFLHHESERERWAPLDARRHRAVSGPPEVTPEVILAQAEELLREEGPDGVIRAQSRSE